MVLLLPQALARSAVAAAVAALMVVAAADTYARYGRAAAQASLAFDWRHDSGAFLQKTCTPSRGCETRSPEAAR